MPSKDDVRVRIRNLRLRVHSGGVMHEPVKGIDLTLHAGESLGLVGESGSGKSLTSSSITQLNDRRIFTTEADEFDVLGRNIGEMRPSEILELRRRDARMIFQNPMSSLNPVMKIGTQMKEAIPRELRTDKRRTKEIILDLLERVEIEDPSGVIGKYPHELSGGMRQRIVIAMAISAKPKIIIADEPTTALDVHTQAAVLTLLHNLVREEGSSLIFVSHDLSVVAGLTTRVMVMRKGLVVEEGPTAEILSRPSHPYTLGLVRSIPRLTDSRADRYFTMSDLNDNGGAIDNNLREPPHDPALTTANQRIGGPHE